MQELFFKPAKVKSSFAKFNLTKYLTVVGALLIGTGLTSNPAMAIDDTSGFKLYNENNQAVNTIYTQYDLRKGIEPAIKCDLIGIKSVDIVTCRNPNNGEPINIRLNNIDATEDGQDFKLNAFGWLRSTLVTYQDALYFQFNGLDFYKRPLGTFYIKGYRSSKGEVFNLNVNALLLERGLAFPYFYGDRNSKKNLIYKYCQIANATKSQNLGVWNRENWISGKIETPDEYRARMKGKPLNRKYNNGC